MHLEVTFRNIRPRDEIKKRGEVLYSKLERFLDPSAEGKLLVSVEHGQAILELVIAAKGDVHKVEEEDAELRAGLDKLFHKMETHLRRSKERRQDRRRGGREPQDGFVTEPDDEDELTA